MNLAVDILFGLIAALALAGGLVIGLIALMDASEKVDDMIDVDEDDDQ